MSAFCKWWRSLATSFILVSVIITESDFVTFSKRVLLFDNGNPILLYQLKLSCKESNVHTFRYGALSRTTMHLKTPHEIINEDYSFNRYAYFIVFKVFQLIYIVRIMFNELFSYDCPWLIDWEVTQFNLLFFIYFLSWNVSWQLSKAYSTMNKFQLYVYTLFI